MCGTGVFDRNDVLSVRGNRARITFAGRSRPAKKVSLSERGHLAQAFRKMAESPNGSTIRLARPVGRLENRFRLIPQAPRLSSRSPITCMRITHASDEERSIENEATWRNRHLRSTRFARDARANERLPMDAIATARRSPAMSRSACCLSFCRSSAWINCRKDQPAVRGAVHAADRSPPPEWCCCWSRSPPAPWPDKVADYGHLAVAGVLIQGLALGCAYLGLQLGVSAGIVGLVNGLAPLLAALGAVPFLGERVGPRAMARPVRRPDRRRARRDRRQSLEVRTGKATRRRSRRWRLWSAARFTRRSTAAGWICARALSSSSPSRVPSSSSRAAPRGIAGRVEPDADPRLVVAFARQFDRGVRPAVRAAAERGGEPGLGALLPGPPHHGPNGVRGAARDAKRCRARRLRHRGGQHLLGTRQDVPQETET